MRMTLFAVSLVLVAAGARGGWDCENSAARRVSAPLTGVSHIKVVGRAGTLRVTGRPGVREVVAIGTACSSEKTFLAGLDRDRCARRQRRPRDRECRHSSRSRRLRRADHREDGGGGIDYERVGGKVTIPRK